MKFVGSAPDPLANRLSDPTHRDRTLPPSVKPQLPFPLLGDYAPGAAVYDEVHDADGKMRPVWSRLATAAGGISTEEFARRWMQTERLLDQNSLAYPDRHAHIDSDSATQDSSQNRPWRLDAFPLLLDAAEWKSIVAALEQRANLLERVLQDLLGPQELIAAGHLPREFVYHHPGFRLPYVDQNPSGGRFLHFYSADLARAPDGNWWVMNDRTEAPLGLGFALENRIALSRLAPDVIRQCQVRRLAPFFETLKQRLVALDPQRRENPRIVVLSQQAGSDSYFEDAFLCRYLGYTLAEPGDLAVRSGQLYLKTLGGLSPVDVLVRRPDSDSCDPLELVGSTKAGVPGLLQASRSGALAVANAMGSGLVQSLAFMAFMPRLCQKLLGQPLLMPGIATWWCGEKTSLDLVLSRLEELVIKPAFLQGEAELQQTLQLAELSPLELAERIRANPMNYVAQERISHSVAPVWDKESVGAGYVALRAFAVAGESGRYALMPGGLARVSTRQEPLEQSLMGGERSKDTWVLSKRPQPHVSLLRPEEGAIKLRRGGAELPSRVAENLFWLGRHTERAEAGARIVRTVTLRLTSDEETSQIAELPMLVRVLAENGLIEPGFALDEIRASLPAIESSLPATVFDNGQLGSLRSTVTRVAELASVVRDRMSLDCWRVIRQLEQQFWPRSNDTNLSELLEAVDTLLLNLSSFTGLVLESMTRTEGWRFLELGRRIERGVQTIRLLHIGLLGTKAKDHASLEAILETADSLMTYRSRYLAQMRLGPVLDLLLTDETNPRSVAYQLAMIEDHMHALPREPQEAELDAHQQLSMSLLHNIRMANAQELANAFRKGDTEPLEWLLVELEATLPKLSEALNHRYLLHVATPHRLDEAPATEIK